MISINLFRNVVMPSYGTVDDMKSLLPFPLPKQQLVAHHSLCSFGGNLWRAFSKSANCSLHISLFKTVHFIPVLLMLCSLETFPILPLLPLSSYSPSWGNLKHKSQKGTAFVLVVQAWQKTEIPGGVRQKCTPEEFCSQTLQAEQLSLLMLLLSTQKLWKLI